MKKLKIAMMSMTHGHTRKYYDVLKNNPKLEWIAVSTANEEVKKIFLNSVQGIPCYDSDEAGQKAAHKAIRLLSSAGLKTTVIQMKGAKDPDEYIKNFVRTTGFSEAKLTAKVINRAGTSTHILGKPRGTGAQSIDHIFGSQDVEFLYFNTLIDNSILDASDHLPIYADIKFKN